METIRTFTVFNIFDSNVNITVELIKNDHYEVRVTFSIGCTCNRLFTITRKFRYYCEAKDVYDNEVHIIIDHA